jgi:hypothetical protein
MISGVLAGLVVPWSPSEGKVVQAGDAEHGVMNAVAFQAAVAEDLPSLHPGEGVLDTGADLAVGSFVLLFPGWQLGLASLAAVRDDQAGVPVAAIGDHRGVADGAPRFGQFPRLAVVAVVRNRPTDRDDEPGVGIDDDLVVGGVPVVFRLLRYRVITRGDQGAASTISTVFLRNRWRYRNASEGPRWPMMRSAADFEIPNSRASCRRVRFVRQYAATSSCGTALSGRTQPSGNRNRGWRTR